MNENLGPIWDASECVLVLIDYQPEMFRAIRSSDPEEIDMNVCTLARTAKSFGMPIVLSTVGVKSGVNKPTVESLKNEIPDIIEIDRNTMNAWEDVGFLKAIQATGSKRLVMCGLWTEICLTYPAISALADGYEVCFIADAVGGRSKVEHKMGIARMIQAGAIPNTTFAMAAEWFRDWNSPRAQNFKKNVVPFLQERREQLRTSAGTRH